MQMHINMRERTIITKKHIGIILILFALSAFLCTSCGKKTDSVSSVSEYYDIVTETEKLFMQASGDTAGNSGRSGNVIGMQFYQGEPVKLVQASKYENGIVLRDICLYRADGSSSILQQNLQEHCLQGFIDEEGSFYSVQLAVAEGNFKYDIVKYSALGEPLFQSGIDGVLSYAGQLDKGKMILGLLGSGLRLLDTETGELSEPDDNVQAAAAKAVFVIGVKENGVIVADSSKIWAVDLKTAEETQLLSCVGTTYELRDLLSDISDCRVLEDGKLVLLYQSSREGEGTLETLASVNVGEGRTPVVFRGMQLTNSLTGAWLKDRIVDFNSMDENYFIVLQECPEGTAQEDYARMTSVEIAAGKGPDILMGSVLDDYIQGMIEKGAFEDLSGYMEKSGIREEDYFPGAFSCYRNEEEVYGVVPTLWVNSYMVNKEVLGSDVTPDAAKLVQAMLDYPEPVLYYFMSSVEIVEQLLYGSENLWGMIDWEAGTCDFGGELFSGILEAAKKCGYVAAGDYIDAEAERERYTLAVESNACWSLYSYRNQSEMEEEGMVPFGVLFDKGCYAVLSANQCMVLNANAANKDGAWEFLSFLLQEEVQKTGREYSSGYPASRAAFEQLLLQERIAGPKKVSGAGNSWTEGDGKALTEQDMEELRRLLTEARYVPIRTEAVLDIVYEEAQDYFNDIKTIEQVAEVIENRVRLYLEEQRK